MNARTASAAIVIARIVGKAGMLGGIRECCLTVFTDMTICHKRHVGNSENEPLRKAGDVL